MKVDLEVRHGEDVEVNLVAPNGERISSFHLSGSNHKPKVLAKTPFARKQDVTVACRYCKKPFTGRTEKLAQASERMHVMRVHKKKGPQSGQKATAKTAHA